MWVLLLLWCCCGCCFLVGLAFYYYLKAIFWFLLVGPILGALTLIVLFGLYVGNFLLDLYLLGIWGWFWLGYVDCPCFGIYGLCFIEYALWIDIGLEEFYCNIFSAGVMAGRLPLLGGGTSDGLDASWNFLWCGLRFTLIVFMAVSFLLNWCSSEVLYHVSHILCAVYLRCSWYLGGVCLGFPLLLLFHLSNFVLLHLCYYFPLLVYSGIFSTGMCFAISFFAGFLVLSGAVYFPAGIKAGSQILSFLKLGELTLHFWFFWLLVLKRHRMSLGYFVLVISKGPRAFRTFCFSLLIVSFLLFRGLRAPFKDFIIFCWY